MKKHLVSVSLWSEDALEVGEHDALETVELEGLRDAVEYARSAPELACEGLSPSLHPYGIEWEFQSLTQDLTTFHLLHLPNITNASRARIYALVTK